MAKEILRILAAALKLIIQYLELLVKQRRFNLQDLVQKLNTLKEQLKIQEQQRSQQMVIQPDLN